MKNKGFTLIELLGVIMILAILTVLTFPPLLDQIRKSKLEIKNSTKALIIDSAKDYYEDNKNSYEKIEGMTYCIDINTLTDNGYLNKKIKDENINDISNTKKVKMIYHNNKFDYDVADGCEKYTVTFDANGGNVDIDSKEVIQDSVYGELPIPTREGYTFLGWNGKNIIDKSQSTKEEIQNETPFSSWGAPPVFNNDWIVNNLRPNTQYSISYEIEGISVPKYDSKFSGNLGLLLYSQASLPATHLMSNDGHYISVGEKYHYQKTFSTPSNVNLSESKYVLYAYSNRFLINDVGVAATIRLYNLQLEEGNTATEYEPYYITSSTKVVQQKDHTLKAIWQAN